jgi:ABC-2 type transport system ATP-binding protein
LKVYYFISNSKGVSSPESTDTADPSKDDGFYEAEMAAVDESATAIDVDGLELVYSDGTAAVRGIEMDVPEGEFFGFLGPNGAGKTTTI